MKNMERRGFLKLSSLLALGTAAPGSEVFKQRNTLSGENKINRLPGENKTGENKNGLVSDREYWAKLLYKIALPVLGNMSKGELRKKMPVEYSPTWDGRDKNVAYLEALGRLMAGLAPWLALPEDTTEEGTMRRQLKNYALQSLTNSVDPSNPDYLLWNKEGQNQPLVDAAYMAEAFLRAPGALWQPLDAVTQQRFIAEFIKLRRVKAVNNNWVLFPAVIETFLLSVNAPYNQELIDFALQQMNKWYVGDGFFSDGPRFAIDYYNSYDMHNMQLDVLKVLVDKGKVDRPVYDLSLRRMQRYAEYLERIISPEGTYPAYGRSVTYRLAVFQPLVQLVLLNQLPDGVSYAQVRSALTAVMKRMFEQPGIFTKDGWLQLGFAGHQPTVADYYSNSGSMYITSVGFLALGLPADHEFWTAPYEDWSSRKAWSGQPFRKDYAVNY